MTFAGNPRDGYVHHHAHESPQSMTVPLVILAIPAAIAGGSIPWTGFSLDSLLLQARPTGIEGNFTDGLMWPSVTMPAELPHLPEIALKAEWAAFGMAMLGFVLATAFYGLRKLDPEDVRATFPWLHRILVRKWFFDELYSFVFVQPVLRVSDWVAAIDKRVIDWLADNSARAVAAVARLDDWIDRVFIDALVNLTARWTYALGLQLRTLQTGNIRQYVMWLAVGAVGLFVLMSFYWNYAVVVASG